MLEFSDAKPGESIPTYADQSIDQCYVAREGLCNVKAGKCQELIICEEVKLDALCQKTYPALFNQEFLVEQMMNVKIQSVQNEVQENKKQMEINIYFVRIKNVQIFIHLKKMKKHITKILSCFIIGMVKGVQNAKVSKSVHKNYNFYIYYIDPEFYMKLIC